jgi:hypothetical protein
VKPKENYKRLLFYTMPQLLILVEENYSEVQLYETYNKNAQIRFDGIKSLIKAGDKLAIDVLKLESACKAGY